MDFPVLPRNWTDFFNVLKKSAGPWILCIDEFQYLAESSPELPSLVQKFVDHSIRQTRRLRALPILRVRSVNFLIPAVSAILEVPLSVVPAILPPVLLAPV